LRKDEEAISPSPSSTTDDEESQSLRQSSVKIGDGRIGLRDEDRGETSVGGGRGPLKDSTVLLIPLVVGLI
jgi:hypothetical protein